MTRAPRLGFLTTLILSVTGATAAVASDDGGWHGEIGVMAGEHDNFFFRGGDNPAPASNLLSGYVELERTWDLGGHKVDLQLAGEAVDVVDISEGDYQTYAIGGRYKRGRHRWSLEFAQLLNRLYSESGEAVFFDETSYDLQWRMSVGERWWFRLRYELSEWDFDSLQDSRDADIDKISVTGRYQALPTLGIRLAWLDENRDAVGAENNRVGDGFEVAFEGSPTETVTWFLRFRTRDRDYEDAPPEERNFGRSDTTDDINFNLRWLFADQIGLYLRDSYRDGESTRADRNYTGNVAEAGLYFKF